MSIELWEKLLDARRDDFIGGDVETSEDMIAYRSPISDITLVGEIVTVKGPWTAKHVNGCWQKHTPHTDLFVNAKAVAPQELSEGRVHFSLPFLGFCTLYPKGGDKLDPAEVQGLLGPPFVLDALGQRCEVDTKLSSDKNPDLSPAAFVDSILGEIACIKYIDPHLGHSSSVSRMKLSETGWVRSTEQLDPDEKSDPDYIPIRLDPDKYIGSQGGKQMFIREGSIRLVSASLNSDFSKKAPETPDESE